MEKIRFVGLDVHSRSIAVAVAEANGLPPENFRDNSNRHGRAHEAAQEAGAAEELARLL